MKIVIFVLLMLSTRVFANIELPKSTDASIPAVIVGPTAVILKAEIDKNYIANALIAGSKISPQWPEIILALMIVNDNIGNNGNSISITYNNYSISLSKMDDKDKIYEFGFEKIGEKSKEKIPGLVNPPTGETEKKLSSMGFKVVDLKEKGQLIYLEMPSSQIEPFLGKVDAALLVLFPSWQNGARQTIAAISRNSKAANVQIPYNGYLINIFQNSFIFSNGSCKFILGISEMK